jgi:anaerobic selenocysteine-containing dehydrogenase
VEPQFNTRHIGDVVIQLAQAMGDSIAAAFPWENYETCLEETLGDKWGTLLENGYWIDTEFGTPAGPGAFETVSGKFEFTNKEIAELARFSPLKPEGDETTYPLVLIPFDSMRLWNGYIGDPQYLIKTVDDSILKKSDVLVEINPATALSLGLADGKTATLASPKGKTRVRIHFYEGIMPGLVALPRGLGHTAYEKNLAGKGINFNELIGPVEDAASGQDAAWGIRAKLTRA